MPNAIYVSTSHRPKNQPDTSILEGGGERDDIAVVNTRELSRANVPNSAETPFPQQMLT